MTTLRIPTSGPFILSHRKWVQEQADLLAATRAASAKEQAALYGEYDRYLATLAPDDQRTAALEQANVAYKLAKGGGANPQEFQPTPEQRTILARLGTPSHENEFKQSAEVTLAEMVAAAAVDLKKEIGRIRNDEKQHGQRIREMEGRVHAAEQAEASVRAELADRDQDNAALREENAELGKHVEFLRQQYEGIEGKPAPEEKPKRSLLGKDRSKRHRTSTAGVTFREKADGSKTFSVLVPDKNGDGKDGWETVGPDYDQAIERRVEVLEQREAAAA